MPTLQEIAGWTAGELVGEGTTEIRGVASLEDATPSDLSFAVDSKALKRAEESGAGALLVPMETAPDTLSRPMVRVADPRRAFAGILERFLPPEPIPPGIHPTAAIAADARIAPGVSVMAHAVIESGASVGEGVVLYPGVYVGRGVSVGEGTIIHANAVLRERTEVGRRCVIHAGAVIGSDGFGFVSDGAGHERIPHIGRVVIGDDVEVGANAAVDRAMVGVTRVGDGTKIDNLVQIGHNVKVGSNAILSGLTGVAGSAVLGDEVTLAGQSGVADHASIGSGATVAARGLVTGEAPGDTFLSGFPARPHAENMRTIAATRKLPELLKRVQALEREIAVLQQALPVIDPDHTNNDEVEQSL